MILDVDIGNTRVKWRLCGDDGAVYEYGCGTVSTWDEHFARISIKPRRVRVSCVGASAGASTLYGYCVSRWKVVPEFAQSSASAAGVVNGYVEPSKLGVDRWLAILAAYKRCKRAVCVIDAGTAITVDTVNLAGEHLGGFIAPGLKLMADALWGGTQDVRFDRGIRFSAGSANLGRSTADAVYGGVLNAAAGLIQRAMSMGDSDQALILTGGDAACIAGLLAEPYEIVPELVMDGLAIALP